MVLVPLPRSQLREGIESVRLGAEGFARTLDELFEAQISDESFVRALELLTNELASPRAALAQLDEFGELVLLNASGFDPSILQELQMLGVAPDEWRGAWGDALRDAHVRVCNQPTRDGHPGFRSERELAAPIRFDGANIGLLYAANKANDYDDADHIALELCARRLGPVLAYTLTARRFRRQLDAAEEMARAAAEGERFFMMSRDLMAISDTRIRRSNAVFGTLLGLEDHELRDKSLADLTHPNDRALIERELHQMRTEPNREHPPVAVQMLGKSGELRKIEWVGAATEEGIVYAVGRDITALSQAFEKLEVSNKELQRLYAEAHAEEVLAGRIFSHVRAQGCLDTPGIQYVTSSLGFFSGDVTIAAVTPSGELRWMLGDFTGHGLSAAIGTAPLAGAFHLCVREDVPFDKSIATINDLLKGILPPGIFCACALLCLNAAGDTISIWNCGLPPILMRMASDGSLVEHASQCLPLGLLKSHELQISPARVPVQRGDDVLVFSDGLTESVDANGAMFGVDRVKQALISAQRSGEGFGAIMRAVSSFRGAMRANDDVSLICVSVGHTRATVRAPHTHAAQDGAGSAESSQR